MDEHRFTISLTWERESWQCWRGCRAPGVIAVAHHLHHSPRNEALLPKTQHAAPSRCPAAVLQLKGSRRAALIPWEFWGEFHSFPAGELDMRNPSLSQQ